MDYKKQYNLWLTDDCFNSDTKRELESIAGDDAEIEDRFYTSLEFGTGGLRGVMGAGTNRMNFYTVGKAAQGMANYILKKGSENAAVCIGFDSRRLSREFAKHCALVMAASGIKAYLFDKLCPTPMLSFAVRELEAVAGIMITASHNPPEYNGFKAYWDDGGQVVPPQDTEIIDEVASIASFGDVCVMDEEKAQKAGLLIQVGDKIIDKFIKKVKEQNIETDEISKIGKNLKIVYTPLNGAGNETIRRVLKELGFSDVTVVPEQEAPDGNFPTLEYPNPEDPKAFEYAIKLAKSIGADIVLATDPDADRMGAACKNAKGEYVMLSGNQIGCLLCEYVLNARTKTNNLPENPAVITSIVSTNLARSIALSYGAECFEVLTGFKNIAAQMKRFDETRKYNFVYAFEESYGYLAGTHARDKDAVVAVSLFCEYAALLKSKGSTLLDAMSDIYTKHGYYKEITQSITLKGQAGLLAIRTVMENLRSDTPVEIAGRNVQKIRDYKKRISLNPKTGREEGLSQSVSDVLYYELDDGSWFCIRPSGTEPKIKIYFGVNASTESDADEKMKSLSAGAMYIINKEIP